MERFQGKYRVPSTRWATWDYGRNAAYFVTICVAQREHAFGEIVGGALKSTALGQIAADCWVQILDHFPFVVPDEFVVMPNHVHGILVIDKPESATVETQDLASLPPASLQSASLRFPANRFGPQSRNLASIVRGYKIGVTKYAGRHEIPFAWQARYHDRVIRDAGEHARIGEYIRTNPEHWTDDLYYAQLPGPGQLTRGNQ